MNLYIPGRYFILKYLKKSKSYLRYKFKKNIHKNKERKYEKNNDCNSTS